MNQNKKFKKNFFLGIILVFVSLIFTAQRIKIVKRVLKK